MFNDCWVDGLQECETACSTHKAIQRPYSLGCHDRQMQQELYQTGQFGRVEYN